MGSYSPSPAAYNNCTDNFISTLSSGSTYYGTFNGSLRPDNSNIPDSYSFSITKNSNVDVVIGGSPLISIGGLYDVNCAYVGATFSFISGGYRYNNIPIGTYYVILYGSSWPISYNITVTITQVRQSGCAAGNAGIRFKNNSASTWIFRLYDVISCGGAGYQNSAWNNISSGATSGYGCVPGGEIESPGAYDGGSSYICGDSTSTFEAGRDYTIELKSNDSWERTIDY